MRFRSLVVGFMLSALLGAGLPLVPAKGETGAHAQSSSSSSSTPYQRLEVLRQRLDSLRHSLSSAIVNLGGDPAAKEKKDKKDQQAQANAPDDSATSDAIARLRGLDKEANSLMSDLLDIRGKVDRAERYDVAQIDKLESAVADLNGRAETALRETAGL